MAKLNQIIAIEKTAKTNGENALTSAYQGVQRATALSGIARSYTAKDDDGDQLPSESTLVQTTISDIVAGLQNGEFARLFDVVLTKESANTLAKADVVVDGNVILKDAPVSFLLFLERKVNDLKAFISKLPTLDPAEKWTADPATNTWATDPSETSKTKKVPRNWVKADATDKHPAQVEMYYEDVIVGTWKTIKFSGALPAARVRELSDRVEKLSEAIKFAREQANSIDVTDRKAGKSILDYVFA